MRNNYYGSEISGKITSINPEFHAIKTPDDLYSALKKIWCEYSCAPRMRSNWSENNITLGQCSITAFLAQDIFGGKVFGIPNDDGSFHCYNRVGDYNFDLTSEQFGGEILNYNCQHEQFREKHFANSEKKLRYEYLRSELEKFCRNI